MGGLFGKKGEGALSPGGGVGGPLNFESPSPCSLGRATAGVRVVVKGFIPRPNGLPLGVSAKLK